MSSPAAFLSDDQLHASLTPQQINTVTDARPGAAGALGRHNMLQLALLLVLQTGAVAGASMATGCARDAVAGGPAGAAAPADQAISATTIVAQEAEVPRTLALTGTLLPNRQSQVAADAVGKVTATFVERGSLVKRGAPLVRLDQRSASLGEQEAAAHAATTRSQNQLARTECNRAQRLFDAGAINQAELDRIQTQCEAASYSLTAAAVRVGLARKALTDALVRAPFSGEIAERFVSEGEFVRPDSRVVTLMEVDTLRLELNVPETAVAQISRAQEVHFSVAAFPEESFRGRVRFVGASVRRSSRDLLVEAVVENSDRRLRPGMFATAQLTLGTQRQTVIPASTLRQGRADQPERIFVVNPKAGRVEERLVLLGERQGDRVVVVDGLHPGDRVVTNPGAGVHDGARLK